MNRTLAETMHANITAVGLPQWTDADVQLAKATQKELGVPEDGLVDARSTELRGRESQPDEDKRGGGSDDIGDISWTLPTVSLELPGQLPGRTRPQLGQRHCRWRRRSRTRARSPARACRR